MPTQTNRHAHTEEQMFGQVDAGMQMMHAAAARYPLLYDPADLG